MRTPTFRVRFQAPAKTSKRQTGGFARQWAEMSQTFVTVWDLDMFV